jgi:hypothetical protein
MDDHGRRATKVFVGRRTSLARTSRQRMTISSALVPLEVATA